jgi:hypothetical protein
MIRDTDARIEPFLPDLYRMSACHTEALLKNLRRNDRYNPTLHPIGNAAGAKESASTLTAAVPKKISSRQLPIWVKPISIILFVFLGLFPPWTQRVYGPYGRHAVAGRGYGLIFTPPAPPPGWAVVQIDWSRLALEWLVVAAIIFGVVRWAGHDKAGPVREEGVVAASPNTKEGPHVRQHE